MPGRFYQLPCNGFAPIKVLKTLLTPQYEGLFKHGKPPIALKLWMDHAIGWKLTPKMVPIVHKSIKQFYHQCWIDYCDLLHRKKQNFSSRLKTIYKITPHEISAKIAEIRSNRNPDTGSYDPMEDH